MPVPLWVIDDCCEQHGARLKRLTTGQNINYYETRLVFQRCGHFCTRPSAQVCCVCSRDYPCPTCRGR